jgi:hypothetical protein
MVLVARFVLVRLTRLVREMPREPADEAEHEEAADS